MIEKHIVLEDIDPVIFYGVNNANMQMIKALYPKLRIVARGNVIKVMGDEEEMCAFEESILALEKHIVKNRADKPIETTFELNEIIKAAVPAKMRQNGHPSKQTFQAIRIECNQELEVLKKALDELIDLLNPGGRFCIITFHSLEESFLELSRSSVRHIFLLRLQTPSCLQF